MLKNRIPAPRAARAQHSVPARGVRALRLPAYARSACAQTCAAPESDVESNHMEKIIASPTEPLQIQHFLEVPFVTLSIDLCQLERLRICGVILN